MSCLYFDGEDFKVRPYSSPDNLVLVITNHCGFRSEEGLEKALVSTESCVEDSTMLSNGFKEFRFPQAGAIFKDTKYGNKLTILINPKADGPEEGGYSLLYRGHGERLDTYFSMPKDQKVFPQLMCYAFRGWYNPQYVDHMRWADFREKFEDVYKTCGVILP
jgi:hypothetical protein